MTNDPTDDQNGNTLSSQASELTYTIDEAERPSMAAVRAVASLTNTPVIDIEPLYKVIDPEQLDGILEDIDDDASGGERSVMFDIHGCRVTVTQKTVAIRKRDDDT